MIPVCMVLKEQWMFIATQKKNYEVARIAYLRAQLKLGFNPTNRIAWGRIYIKIYIYICIFFFGYSSIFAMRGSPTYILKVKLKVSKDNSKYMLSLFMTKNTVAMFSFNHGVVYNILVLDWTVL